MRIITFVLAACLALPSVAYADDTLVIPTDDLRPALTEWTAFRTEQGHSIRIRAPGDDVAATIRRAHERTGGALRHVLLLGDVDRVPCAYRKAVAIAEWEADDRIATDAPLADLDGDGVPDLSIGRLPAHSVDESRALLLRSIAYEENPPPGMWRRRLAVIAGVGGFGAQADMALEMVTRLILNNDVPVAVATEFTYAKESSAFCPPPPRLQDNLLRTLTEGALVVAYIGHGSAGHVDRMTWRDRRYPILEADAAQTITCAGGPPLLVFVACTTGRYDGKEDSLAEIALRRPDGPAAVIASSRVSTPYGNGILSVELLDAVYGGGEKTVGEILLRVKQRLAAAGSDLRTRKTLEAMAGSFYEADAEKRAIDRREHVLLYQLLGDPLLRLARPRAAKLAPPSKIALGSTARVLVMSPIAGEFTLELLPRRAAHALPRKPGRTADQFATDYARANVTPVVTVTGSIERPSSGTVITLDVPSDLDVGRYQLRVWIEGDDGVAAAGTTVRVTQSR